LQPEDTVAKRKLSPEQRVTIRKEIREYLTQKMKPSEIQKLVAKKYGITTITARWYLKSVRDPQSPSSARATPAKGAKRRAARKPRKASAPRNGHPQAGGAIHRLVANIEAIAEEAFSRGRQAKKLVPQWRAYVSKELTLKKLESRVRRELRVISSRAKALHAKIRALTSR
jgi:hypothetical protein